MTNDPIYPPTYLHGGAHLAGLLVALPLLTHLTNHLLTRLSIGLVRWGGVRWGGAGWGAVGLGLGLRLEV